MEDKTQKGRKLCVNCVHYDLDHTGAICQHLNATTTDLVTGSVYQSSCFFMRADTSPCGANGKLFTEL